MEAPWRDVVTYAQWSLCRFVIAPFVDIGFAMSAEAGIGRAGWRR